MADSIIGLTQALQNTGAVIKTGFIVSSDAYSAIVNIEGIPLTLKFLDSVTSGIGRIVVCAIQGDTGFILGTLDNTSRTALIPDMASKPNTSTTVPSATSGTNTYAPKATASYNLTSSTWQYSNSDVRQATNMNGFWFYGANRFKELQDKTVTDFRIYIVYKSGTSAQVQWHGYGLRPSGSPSFSGTARTATGGWFSLPTAWADLIIAGTGSGGICVTGTSSANLKGLPDGGTLKITWKK